MIFLDIRHEQAWLYEYQTPGKPWLAGGSLCYTKAVWQKYPFDDMTYGEDTQFLWSQEDVKVFPMSHFAFYVAMIHPANTICKDVDFYLLETLSLTRVSENHGGLIIIFL